MFENTTYAFLDDFRGTIFSGEWPTLVEMYRITVQRHPKRPCFTIYEPGRISLSYEEALAKIEAAARWLHAAGVRKGDRVALTGKNAPEWTVAYLAILFAGGVVVPIDAQLHIEECARLLQTADVKILFADEDKHDTFVREKTARGLQEVVSLHNGAGAYLYTLDGPPATIELPTEHDLAAILFTSGTTGTPKGVMLTHRNFVSDCYLSQTHFNVFHTDTFYALLPLHHAYAMLAVFWKRSRRAARCFLESAWSRRRYSRT